MTLQYLQYYIRPEDTAAFEQGILDLQDDPYYQNGRCDICLQPIFNGQPTALIAACRHGFHRGCLERWHGDCPVCRGPRNEIGPRRVYPSGALTEDDILDLYDDFPNLVSFHLELLPGVTVQMQDDRPILRVYVYIGFNVHVWLAVHLRDDANGDDRYRIQETLQIHAILGNQELEGTFQGTATRVYEEMRVIHARLATLALCYDYRPEGQGGFLQQYLMRIVEFIFLPYILHE